MNDYIRAMASYNRWMNQRIYEVCSLLSDEERKSDRGAYFKSIHGTLNHLLLADRIWLGRFAEQPFHFESLDQELYSDFTELRTERERSDQDISAWAKSFNEADRNRELCYVSAVNPQMRTYPYWFAVTHFFNHQTHHRGQITTLLSQQGIDPGVMDFIYLPEYRAGIPESKS